MPACKHPMRLLLSSLTVAIITILLSLAINEMDRRKTGNSFELKRDHLGFQVLSSPPAGNITVDIVLIHGLDGHREKSWTSKNGVAWLRDLLPTSIESARILTYGYDATTWDSSRVSTQNLFRHATSFAEQLAQQRFAPDAARRPIIFIAHSLGGILVKRALVYCASQGPHNLEHLRAIKVSTFGILYFGTPHSGANGAQLELWLVRLFSTVMHVNTKMVKSLRRDSEELEQLGQEYLPISHDFETFFFYETYPTPILGGKSIEIAPFHLVTIPGVLNARPVAIIGDHISMVKFNSAEDSEYRRVSNYLGEMVQGVSIKVKENWRREELNALASSSDMHRYQVVLSVRMGCTG